MAEIGRNYHILFAFRAICINNILNENTDSFRKSEEPAALLFLIQYDRHGLSSVYKAVQYLSSSKP